MIRGGDSEIFTGKTLSALLQDIYTTSLKNREDIKILIKQLVEFIKSSSDAVNIAPIIQAFMEVSVKNDDQLSKIATIVQRIISAEAYQRGDADPTEILTEEEREFLVKQVTQGTAEVKEKLIEATEQVNKLVNTNVSKGN